jgi:hypothetical protein
MPKYLSIDPFSPTENIFTLRFIFTKTSHFQTMATGGKIIF